MNVNCPRCGGAIPTADVNVATDVAACRRCDGVFKLSELMSRSSDVPLAAPPPGAWYQELADGFRAGATTRSWVALFIVPFMLVWSGGAIGGIFGVQIARRSFIPGMSLAAIPFIIASVVFGTFALMTVAGRVELCVRGDDAEVFVGVRSLGWRRRFHWSEIRTVTEVATRTNYPGGQGTAIALEGATRIKFASGVNEARRYFLLNALRRKLKHAPPSAGGPFRA